VNHVHCSHRYFCCSICAQTARRRAASPAQFRRPHRPRHCCLSGPVLRGCDCRSWAESVSRSCRGLVEARLRQELRFIQGCNKADHLRVQTSRPRPNTVHHQDLRPKSGAKKNSSVLSCREQRVPSHTCSTDKEVHAKGSFASSSSLATALCTRHQVLKEAFTSPCSESPEKTRAQ
jgi:hypothetical protein